MKRARVVLLLAWMTGCAGIIGVPDLTLEEGPVVDGGNDGRSPVDGTVADGSSSGLVDARPVGDAGAPDADAAPETDGATCDLSKTASDPLHCGACNHACLDDAGCAQGTCGVIPLTTINDVTISDMVEAGGYVYATAGDHTPVDANMGVWRVDKLTGDTVHFAPLLGADRAVVIGDTLWISSYAYTQDDPDDTDPAHNGGLYRCPLSATPPCTPQLVLPVAELLALQSAGGTLLQFLSSDREDYTIFDTSIPIGAGADAGVAVTDQWGARPLGEIVDFWASPPHTFGFSQGSDSVGVYDQINDTGNAPKVGGYASKPNPGPRRGRITGGPNSVYFTALEFLPGLGSSVQRIDRAAGTACSLGSNPDGGPYEVLRPIGVHVDAKHVFWANQGDYSGAGGSIAVCDVDTCCTHARLLWETTSAPYTMTGDSQRVYWSTDQIAGNVIYKTTKP